MDKIGERTKLTLNAFMKTMNAYVNYVGSEQNIQHEVFCNWGDDNVLFD